MYAVLQENTEPVFKFSPLIQTEEVFVNAMVVGCVWFGWASSWTRATRATSCCTRDIVPSRSHPPGEWTNITSPPHHLGPHGHDCASSCSDVTQLQSSNSSWCSRSKKEILREWPVNILWRKQGSSSSMPPFPHPLLRCIWQVKIEVYLTSENYIYLRYTTRCSDICIYCEMIAMLSLNNIHHLT